jgi:hypothetical protein
MDALEVVVVVVVALAGLLFRVYMRGGFGADADELKRKHKEMDSAQCHQRIIFQVDATQCSRCAEPVHLACADRHTQAHGGP